MACPRCAASPGAPDAWVVPLVGDRGEHAERGVTPVVVVLLDPDRDSSASLLPAEMAVLVRSGRVMKCSSWRSSNSMVECQLSMTASSRAEPARPIDFLIPTRPHVLEIPGGVLDTLVGVHLHIGQGVFAAADRDGASARLPGRGGRRGARPRRSRRSVVSPCRARCQGKVCPRRFRFRCRRRTTCG
jgi:hypothetical protein